MMPDKRILSSTMEDTNIVTASPTRRLSAANLDDPKLKGVLKTIALFELSSTPTKKPPLQRKDSLEQARNSLRLYKEKKRTEVKKDWESPMGSPSRYDNHMDVLDNWNETEWLQKGYSGEIHQQSVTDCSPRRQTSSAAGQHGEFVSRASQHRVVAQVHSPPVERSPQRSVSTNVSRYQVSESSASVCLSVYDSVFK